MSESHELPVPTAASRDPRAVEILRVWVAGGRQHVVIQADAWRDAAAWGIMLADLARHVSRALGHDSDVGTERALVRILSALRAELGSLSANP